MDAIMPLLHLLQKRTQIVNYGIIGFSWCPVDSTVEEETKEAVVSAQSVVHWVSTSSTTKDAYLLGETEKGEGTEVTNFLWVLAIFSFNREIW